MPDMATSGEQDVTPAEGKALVVFFRDSFFSGARNCSLYEVSDDGNITFLGIISNKTKLAYQVAPGDHLFMVDATVANMAQAHLAAGKTYYVLVEPRMGSGFGDVHFGLEPIHHAPGKYSFQSPHFQEWMSDTRFISMTASAQAWYDGNKAAVGQDYQNAIRDWKTDQDDRDQHTLPADDGN